MIVFCIPCSNNAGFLFESLSEIENWANKNGVDGLSFEELVEDARVKKAVLEDVNKLG